MQTSPTSSVPSKQKILLPLCGLALVAAIAFTTYKLWPTREELPSPTGDPVEIVKFIATDKFEQLPLEKQIPYVDEMMKMGFGKIALAAAQAGMTHEDGQRGLRNAMTAGMEVRWGRHLDRWMTLDKKGKEQYVKEVVAKMPKRPPGFDPRHNRGSAPVMTPLQQKKFIESLSPDRRAGLAEFMQAVRAAHGDGGK